MCLFFSVKSAKHAQIYDLFWTIKTRFLLNFLYLSAVIIVMLINILCNLHIYVRRSVFLSFFVFFSYLMQSLCVCPYVCALVCVCSCVCVSVFVRVNARAAFFSVSIFIDCRHHQKRVVPYFKYAYHMLLRLI